MHRKTKLSLVSTNRASSDKTPEVAPPREPSRVILTGAARVLADALDDVHAGLVAGVTVIRFSPDWAFEIVSAGSVLRSPCFGIAAAHVLASEMERRLRGT